MLRRTWIYKLLKNNLTKSEALFYLKPLLALIFICFFKYEAIAERLQNEIAVFTALDKVTANIKKLEVPVNQTSDFGSLRVKAYICYTNPPTEAPKTTSFVQIEEVQVDGQMKKIFSGWMFAESPGLNALEHPVFDIWLTGCEKPKNNLTDGGSHSNSNNETSGDLPDKTDQPSQRGGVGH